MKDGGSSYHRPVLGAEVVSLLDPVPDGTVVDATFGGGGHARMVREEMGDRVKVVGIDRDPDAAEQARAAGIPLMRGDFGDLATILEEGGITDVAGVIFDFGVSSHQLDEPSRGFSYHADGPIDMRMDPDHGFPASEIVNTWPESELAAVIHRYGEEPMARRIARAIVAARPLDRTGDLAAVIAAAVPAARRRRGHPARKTFQALRIVVNDELASIRHGLSAAISALLPGGRVVAISYHSLEDRIVKREFVAGARGCTCPPELPVCGCGAMAELRLVTSRPVRPSEEEIGANPRARSARLRAAEKRRAA